MSMLLRPGFPAVCSATALALGAAVVSAPGCTGASNDTSSSGTPSFEAGAVAASNACGACVAQACTGPWALCLTDMRCVALRGCESPLGESKSAREKCFCDSADAGSSAGDAGSTDPLALYAAFASCNDALTCTTCASDCTSTCANGTTTTTTPSCGHADADADAGAGDGGAPSDASADSDAAADSGALDAGAPAERPTVEACGACVSSKCGNAKRACALATECSAFLGCANACLDVACVEACATRYSTGKASATELSSCTLTSCRSACGL